LPGEELNKFVEGGFYGHPYLSNNRIVRPEFADRKDIIELAAKTIPPAWTFGAHWAGNGFTFLSKDYFPDHKGDIFAAFHGSWNSTVRVGYRVERVLFDKETGLPYGSLRIVGCAPGGQVLARPVDCVEAPDGTVLFSCDQTNKVYRISKAD
jgi:glucose/arabinose dehydrogenase